MSLYWYQNLFCRFSHNNSSCVKFYMKGYITSIHDFVRGSWCYCFYGGTKHQQNAFYSLSASWSVWENVVCTLRSVNLRRGSDSSSTLAGLRKDLDFRWVLQAYHVSDGAQFGNTPEGLRELSVHLSVPESASNKQESGNDTPWSTSGHLQQVWVYLNSQ